MVESDRAVSEIVGIVLIVAIAVALFVTVFVFVSNISRVENRQLNFITFDQDKENGKLIVIYLGSSKPKWSDLSIIPESVKINDTNNDGYVDVNEYLYNCTGKTVRIVSNSGKFLLGTWDFS